MLNLIKLAKETVHRTHTQQTRGSASPLALATDDDFATILSKLIETAKHCAEEIAPSDAITCEMAGLALRNDTHCHPIYDALKKHSYVVIYPYGDSGNTLWNIMQGFVQETQTQYGFQPKHPMMCSGTLDGSNNAALWISQEDFTGLKEHFQAKITTISAHQPRATGIGR